MLVSRCNHSLSKRQTGRSVPEHFVLGGRYSPQDVEEEDWSTSPRAFHARWSVQSPRCRKSRLVDQSLSISCSVVGTVPRMLKRQTGRLVPEHFMSICPKILLFFLKKCHRHINAQCDRASCHLVSLLHKKKSPRTVHPLIAGIKKGNQQLLKNNHLIYCGSS